MISLQKRSIKERRIYLKQTNTKLPATEGAKQLIGDLKQ
jgi:hypothetical protein